jgi:hypothetical protein
MLALSYFITSEMGSQFRGGTLPILYVLLARSHMSVQEVNLITLGDSGEVEPQSATRGKNDVRGVQLVFFDSAGHKKTLYYFSVNLANDGVMRNGLLKFVGQLGEGDSLIKSASYLLHSEAFSMVRNFLLDHSTSIVQDDTGIPIRFFNRANWRLRPFGIYLHPIPIFSGNYQSKLSELFKKGRAGPIDFGIGYRWRPNQSNLLLAESLRESSGRASAP